MARNDPGERDSHGTSPNDGAAVLSRRWRGARRVARRNADQGLGHRHPARCARHRAAVRGYDWWRLRPLARRAADRPRRAGGRQYDIIQYPRPTTLEEDLRLRDFTVNAIAVDLRALLRRRNSASASTRAAASRTSTPGIFAPAALTSFAADPAARRPALSLRRDARLSRRLPRRRSERGQSRRALAGVAPERITDELARLFAAPGAAPAIAGAGAQRSLGSDRAGNDRRARYGAERESSPRCLRSRHGGIGGGCGISRTLDEWAAPEADDFRAWLDTPLAGGRTRRWIVPLAALLHDAAKAGGAQRSGRTGHPSFPRHEQAGGHLAARIAERLRLSRAERDLLVAAIRQHARPNDLQEHGPEHPCV